MNIPMGSIKRWRVQIFAITCLAYAAFYFTRDTRVPPIGKLRAAGVPLALATDSNPGTSPLTSPLLAMNMGATLFRMTVAECIAGFTRVSMKRSSPASCGWRGSTASR